MSFVRSVLLPILRLTSSLAEAARSQRRQPVATDPQLSDQAIFVSTETLKESIDNFRSGVISVMPRLVFNIQAYLIQHSYPLEITLQDFPNDLLPNDSNTSIISTESFSSTDATSLFQTSDFVLINAVKISVLEAIRVIQNSILTSEFSTESGVCLSISIQELQQVYGWWSSDTVRFFMTCKVL